jgi:hypothetical protein
MNERSSLMEGEKKKWLVRFDAREESKRMNTFDMNGRALCSLFT